MQSHHYVMLFLVLALGYVLRGFFPQPAQMLGLPG